MKNIIIVTGGAGFVGSNLIEYLIRAVDILELTDNIPHVTRGSCGSSLVCYLLGISHVDPIKYNIKFFL